MRIQLPEGLTGEQVARRMLFLAYEAAQAVGRGRLQARSGQTEEQVWERTTSRGDYAGLPDRDKPGELFADYVFGRMIKLRVKYGDDYVKVCDLALDAEYQSWVREHPTYEALVRNAVNSLQQPA